MIYEDLTPSINQINSTIRKKRVEATRSVQSNSGGISINGGFSILTQNSAQPSYGLPEEYRVDYTIATDLEEVAEWVTDIDQAVRNLEVGVVSGGRENTVSTSRPSEVTGYPDGAYWTQVQSADELVPIGLWRLTNGAWVEQEVPPNTVTPYLNTGLIDTAVLSAQIIQSDQFWTSLDSMPRVGFNADGFQAYDSDGNLTVSLNGIANTLEGEIMSGPWHIAKRGETYGIFCRSGREQVSERSPGLVMVQASEDNEWPSYFNLRSQLWAATDAGSGYSNVGGPDANESINAYCMIRSAHLNDGVETNEEGRYTWADINWRNQDVLIRNAFPGTGQSLWLHDLTTQLEWRSPEFENQLNLMDTSYMWQLMDKQRGLATVLTRAGQYVTRDFSHTNVSGRGTITATEGTSYWQTLVVDDRDTRTDYSVSTGSQLYLNGAYSMLTGCHGAAMVQLGSSVAGNKAELRVAADTIKTNCVNSVIRTGEISGVNLPNQGAWKKIEVTIGGWPTTERGNPRWQIMATPVDWNDSADITIKIVNINHSANKFTAVITAVQGSTSNGGFLWTAIKTDV